MGVCGQVCKDITVGVCGQVCKDMTVCMCGGKRIAPTVTLMSHLL